MDDFNRNNKVSGVRYLKDNIKNLIVKVTLKPKDSIVSLPKFEEFNHSNDVSEDSSEYQPHHEQNTFKWQQKVFSPQELDHYSKRENCATTQEEYYHELTKHEAKCNRIFTYINEDNFDIKNPFEKLKTNNNNLESCFGNLNLNERINFNKNSESSTDLIENDVGDDVDDDVDKWISMHVMFDNSRYNEDLQLTLKQETVLVSLYWNSSTGCLILKPDVNTLEWNPYLVESDTGVPWNYEYAVELEFGDEYDDEEFRNLIRKLQKKWDKLYRSIKEFHTPSVGIYHYHITIEILTAEEFDNRDLYIDFTIKIPESAICKNNLTGRTNLASYTIDEDKYVWNYSHILELQLECPIEDATPKINIYLEIISQDWWGRLRTEGYSHLLLCADPGSGTRRLLSMRPDEADRVTAEDRRFFIGGCHLLEDLNVLSTPQEFMNPNYKFTSTGAVTLRYQVIRQSPGTTAPASHSLGFSSSSALLSGADAVLRQYKRARAILAAATEGLGSGDGY